MFGPPLKLSSDNAQYLSSQEVEAFTIYVNIRYQFSALYKPSINGKIEQLNGTIIRRIKKLVENNSNNWDVLLPTMLYAYITKIHKSMKISPYEALYGISSRNVVSNLSQELRIDSD